MNRLLLLLLCLLPTIGRGATYSTITGNITDITGSPIKTNTVYFESKSTPLAESPIVFPNFRATATSDTNGDFTVNLYKGNYQVIIRGVAGWRDTSFIIAVPTNSGTFNITALITNAVTYTQTVLPQYVLKTQFTNKGDLIVFDGTNIVRFGVGADGTAIMADSTTATGLKYAAGAGSGTVTSVGLTSGVPGLVIVGSPITEAGNIGATQSFLYLPERTGYTDPGAEAAGKSGLFRAGNLRPYWYDGEFYYEVASTNYVYNSYIPWTGIPAAELGSPTHLITGHLRWQSGTNGTGLWIPAVSWSTNSPFDGEGTFYLNKDTGMLKYSDGVHGFSDIAKFGTNYGTGLVIGNTSPQITAPKIKAGYASSGGIDGIDVTDQTGNVFRDGLMTALGNGGALSNALVAMIQLRQAGNAYLSNVWSQINTNLSTTQFLRGDGQWAVPPGQSTNGFIAAADLPKYKLLTLLGNSGSGTVDVTTNNTLVLVNMSDNSDVTVNLPAAPMNGQLVIVKHWTNEATTIGPANPVYINRNGKRIDTAASNLTMTNTGDSYTLVYDNGANNWNIQAHYTTNAPAGGGGGGDAYLANTQTWTGANTYTNCSIFQTNSPGIRLYGSQNGAADYDQIRIYFSGGIARLELGSAAGTGLTSGYTNGYIDGGGSLTLRTGQTPTQRMLFEAGGQVAIAAASQLTWGSSGYPTTANYIQNAVSGSGFVIRNTQGTLTLVDHNSGYTASIRNGGASQLLKTGNLIITGDATSKTNGGYVAWGGGTSTGSGAGTPGPNNPKAYSKTNDTTAETLWKLGNGDETVVNFVADVAKGTNQITGATTIDGNLAVATMPEIKYLTATNLSGSATNLVLDARWGEQTLIMTNNVNVVHLTNGPVNVGYVKSIAVRLVNTNGADYTFSVPAAWVSWKPVGSMTVTNGTERMFWAKAYDGNSIVRYGLEQ